MPGGGAVTVAEKDAVAPPPAALMDKTPELRPKVMIVENCPCAFVVPDEGVADTPGGAVIVNGKPTTGEPDALTLKMTGLASTWFG